MNQKMILIRGVPGSGKSTLAKMLVDQDADLVHCEADMFMVNKKGRYTYDPTRLKEVHAKCFDMAEDALKDGKSVVVSNTFVRMWEIKPYLSLATRYGAQVEVVALNGGFESIHGVPKDVINRMIQSWEDLDI